MRLQTKEHHQTSGISVFLNMVTSKKPVTRGTDQIHEVKYSLSDPIIVTI